MSEGRVAQERTAHLIVDEYGDIRQWWYVTSAPAMMLHGTVRYAFPLVRVVQISRTAARVGRAGGAHSAENDRTRQIAEAHFHVIAGP